jgi:hypothetical protein
MVTMSTNFKLDDGREFIGQIGKIIDSRLGIEEDRGYFVVGLGIELGGGGYLEYCPIMGGGDRVHITAGLLADTPALALASIKPQVASFSSRRVEDALRAFFMPENNFTLLLLRPATNH